MSSVLIILLLVAAQRLAELAYAQRNTRRLLAEGAVEIAPGHYPLFILLHGSWLVAMLLLVPSGAPINVPLLVLFVVLQLMRVWVVGTLGRFWTTRIITLPGAPLVARGPYRFVRHPNYLVVIGEIAVLPLVFGAWQIALVYSVLNLALLAWRIRAENAALALRRDLHGSTQASAL
ncbi:MAG TPA: isoprenylcysteine carboxylmethyltransferase family protein [Aliidongia sp.]|nr:isoprenylcysteine carboxylmethyltransferase family protein [Aliidongia sp.]